MTSLTSRSKVKKPVAKKITDFLLNNFIFMIFVCALISFEFGWDKYIIFIKLMRSLLDDRKNLAPQKSMEALVKYAR